MEPPLTLWAAPPDRRPEVADELSLRHAPTAAAAVDRMDALDADGEYLEAVVVPPELPDGPGSRVLGEARERWHDVACFTHGDLSAIENTAAWPVSEFLTEGRSVDDVVDAVVRSVGDQRQRPYPVGRDERHRMAVLRDLDLDSVRAELTDIAEHAAGEVGATVAVVSIVDDHTGWLAASSDPEAGRLSSYRGANACTYAIATSTATNIPDLWNDSRLANTDDYRQLGLRAYVGVPLRVDGAAIGTFAVLDEQEGAFADIQYAKLRKFADRARVRLSEHRT